MKNILIAGSVLAVTTLLAIACNNSGQTHTHTHADAHDHAHAYICPMNCEKGKTYDKPGTCPVCNMDLEEVHKGTEANKNEYFTAFSATPAQLVAGQAATLSFTPKVKGNESALVPLDLVHEKKMHVILVSDDLSTFNHIHPEYTATGSYDLKVLGKSDKFTNGRGYNETRFDAGGKYWIFTDYKPSGGLNQVNKTEVNVDGTTAKSVAYTNEKRTVRTDGYDIVLGEGGLKAGSPAQVSISITKGGKTVTPTMIENYLGAKAHVIMLETTTKEFIHTHPEPQGDTLLIETTFARPGTYRGWLQFQTDGVVHTADFVLIVH
jgi:hypothetical protein